ncbi:hypothetical protein [Rubrivivax gelatinosus]|uniref:Uncharacterized protein n=1 Tax=Rubrivivax gelatinosus TaxID=28068 RepID=A0ABS1DNX9_RUBGE|nr:hypothetical protein [Rubrivivax gelatinosus]MBK1711280.1 hypothetical protein [Rubrivivax gelatinosus]
MQQLARRDAAPLAAAALEHELERHRTAVAVLERLAGQLQVLDTFRPALAAKGVKVSYGQVSTTGTFEKAVYLTEPMFDGDWGMRLKAALLELGWKLVECRDGGSYEAVQLTTTVERRRCTVRFNANKPKAATGAGAA